VIRRFNLFAPQFDYDDSDPDGYRAGLDRFGSDIGGQRLGGSVYDVPPGQSICPYHFEWGDEEWLTVLEGRASVRHPEGTDELGPGDTVCFPEGPAGAHKVTNATDAPLRVLMLSTRREPAVSVYPDGDKVGVWGAHGSAEGFFRRESTVDYYDREV
jgi:uncharacterized cupin superfamily protein